MNSPHGDWFEVKISSSELLFSEFRPSLRALLRVGICHTYATETTEIRELHVFRIGLEYTLELWLRV